MENIKEKMYIELGEVCFEKLRYARKQVAEPHQNDWAVLTPGFAVQQPSRRKTRRVRNNQIGNKDSISNSTEGSAYQLPLDSSYGFEILVIDGKETKAYWQDNINGRYNKYYQIDMVFELDKGAYRLSARCLRKDKEKLMQSVLSLRLDLN